MSGLKRIIVIFTLTFLFAFNAAYALNLKEWSYSKDINLSGENKYKAIYLDNDIYKYSNNLLSDIRILDSNNEIVPYYMEYGNSYANSTKIEYDCTLIKNFKEKNNKIFDFSVQPKQLNQDILSTKLEFDLIYQEFLKNIIVYGSYDSISWDYVLEDNLYRVNGYEKLYTGLGDTKQYKFYRIKIINNLENIQLSKMKAVYDYTQTEFNRYENKTSLKFEVNNDEQYSYINISNQNKLPLKQINFTIDGTFNRHYEVNTKDLNTDNYIHTGKSGKIYSLNFKDTNISNKNIGINNSLQSPDIQIKIFNKDDKPLNILGVEAVYYVDKLVFESKPNQKYKLYFGNEGAKKPTYDMESYKSHIEKESQDVCSLGELTARNSSESQKSSVDSKLLFNIMIIVIAVGLISILIVKLRVKNN